MDVLATDGRYGVVYRSDVAAAAQAAGPTGAAVWTLLCTYANGDDGEVVWPHQSTLGELLGVKPVTISRAVASLETAGMIAKGPRTVAGRKTGNEYRLLGAPSRNAHQSAIRELTERAPARVPDDERNAHQSALDERAPERVPRGVTEEDQQGSAADGDAPAAPKTIDEHANEVARNYYEFCKQQSDGLTPNYLALRAAVRKALKDHHCTRREIGEALLALWHDRRTLNPSAAMLVERVVRMRTSTGQAAARASGGTNDWANDPHFHGGTTR